MLSNNLKRAFESPSSTSSKRRKDSISPFDLSSPHFPHISASSPTTTDSPLSPRSTRPCRTHILPTSNNLSPSKYHLSRLTYLLLHPPASFFDSSTHHLSRTSLTSHPLLSPFFTTSGILIPNTALHTYIQTLPPSSFPPSYLSFLSSLPHSCPTSPLTPPSHPSKSLTLCTLSTTPWLQSNSNSQPHQAQSARSLWPSSSSSIVKTTDPATSMNPPFPARHPLNASSAWDEVARARFWRVGMEWRWCVVRGRYVGGDCMFGGCGRGWTDERAREGEGERMGWAERLTEEQRRLVWPYSAWVEGLKMKVKAVDRFGEGVVVYI